MKRRLLAFLPASTLALSACASTGGADATPARRDSPPFELSEDVPSGFSRRAPAPDSLVISQRRCSASERDLTPTPPDPTAWVGIARPLEEDDGTTKVHPSIFFRFACE